MRKINPIWIGLGVLAIAVWAMVSIMLLREATPTPTPVVVATSPTSKQPPTQKPTVSATVSSTSSPTPTMSTTTVVPTSTPTNSPTQTITATPIPMIPQEVIEIFRDQRYFTVCTRDDTPPFESRDEEGKLVGFDIDLIREMAHRWLAIERDDVLLKEFVVKEFSEEELRQQLPIKQVDAEKLLGDSAGVILVIIPTQSRVKCIEEGWADLLVASFGHTIERCEKVTCVEPPYASDGLKLLVRQDSEIENICDMDGEFLSILKGTTAEEHAEVKDKRPIWFKWCPDYGPGPIPTYYQDRQKAIQSVVDGTVAAYTTDGVILQGFASKEEYTDKVKVVGKAFAPETFHLAVPQGFNGLEQLIQSTLGEMKYDGTYDTLHKRTFKCEPPPYPISPNASQLDVKSNDPLRSDIDCPSEERYEIQPNDNLCSIALQHYGECTLYTCIQKHNKISDNELRRLQVGTTLVIPPEEQCQDE